MRLNMPRALKLPPTCRCSSLSQSSAQAMPSARPGRRSSGVRRTSPAMRARAAPISSRVIGLDGRFAHAGCERSPPAAPILRRWITALALRTALDLARTLVRMNTVSRNSNLELIHFIRDELARHGVKSTLTFDDERQKANLFATVGEGKPAGVIVSGHTDTVPWDGQDWSLDPLSAEVKDGRLYGRGSADMKSFIGLAVAQAPAFLAADLPFAIHYAFSYDEEVGCFGAPRPDRRSARARHRAAGLHRRRADRHGAGAGAQGRVPLALLHQGQGRAFVADAAGGERDRGRRARGRQALRHVERYREQGPHYPGFDVPYTTGSVCVIEGGIADNVVPEDCRFHYEFRNLPGSDVAAMQAEVTSLRRQPRAGDAGGGARGRHPLRDDLRDARVPRPRRRSGGAARRPSGRGRGDHAGRLRHRGRPVPEGRHPDGGVRPGHIAQAHQADEYVSLAQLAAGERFLQALMTVEPAALAGRRAAR